MFGSETPGQYQSSSRTIPARHVALTKSMLVKSSLIAGPEMAFCIESSLYESPPSPLETE